MTLRYLETLARSAPSSKLLIPLERTTLLRPVTEHATRANRAGEIQPQATPALR